MSRLEALIDPKLQESFADSQEFLQQVFAIKPADNLSGLYAAIKGTRDQDASLEQCVEELSSVVQDLTVLEEGKVSRLAAVREDIQTEHARQKEEVTREIATCEKVLHRQREENRQADALEAAVAELEEEARSLQANLRDAERRASSLGMQASVLTHITNINWLQGTTDDKAIGEVLGKKDYVEVFELSHEELGSAAVMSTLWDMLPE